VERALHDAVRRDRARTKILRTSPFGLVEMTRSAFAQPQAQRCSRTAPAAKHGVVKTAESMAIEVVRLLILAGHREVSPG